MTRTLRIGYAVLIALPVAAGIVLLLIFAFEIELWQAFVLLAVLDAAIIAGAYVMARRTAAIDESESSDRPRRTENGRDTQPG